jgi:hypothetical protein
MPVQRTSPMLLTDTSTVSPLMILVTSDVAANAVVNIATRAADPYWHVVIICFTVGGFKR